MACPHSPGPGQAELLAQMRRFVEGADCSMENANALEVALDDGYPEDPVIQEFVTMLACYRPGGGAYLYDQKELAREMKRVLAYLEGGGTK